MKKIFRMSAALLALLVALAVMLPCASFGATEGEGHVTPDGEEATTAPAAVKVVPLTRIRLTGSNGKYYLCSPSLADGVDKYSFTIPNWMESVKLQIDGETGMTIASDVAGISFAESPKKTYMADITGITKKSQTYKFTIKKSDATRVLTITINRSEIPCKVESITVVDASGNNVAGSGTIADGMTYTFPTGTSRIVMRILPRHENQVYIVNTTGMSPEKLAALTDSDKITLRLNDTTKRYDYEPTLVEGTNTYQLHVSAGTVEIISNITVIVGDPNANATTTTVETTTTEPTEPAPTTATTLATTAAKDSGLSGLGGGASPIIWVLVGVVIAIVLGACILLIVNLAGKKDDEYYEDYYEEPRPRRRNLGDYVDDDYDDYDSRGRGRRDDYYDDRRGYDDYGSRSRGRRDDYYDDDYRGY